MNLSRCEKGHFYDKEKYAFCPHCAQGVQKEDSVTTLFTENLNTGLDEADSFPDMKMAASEMSGGLASDVTETVTGNPGENDIGEFISGNSKNYNQYEEDIDRTVAFYDNLLVSSENLIQPSVSSEVPRVTSPCAGWLVAVGGVHIGRDFPLKLGKNFIGRDRSMDVVLDGDKSVSRNKHAVLVYDPKSQLYLVQSGESGKLVYLNNEVVLSPTKLSAYDMITVGEVNLLFLPLCGDRFNWNDVIMKK